MLQFCGICKKKYISFPVEDPHESSRGTIWGMSGCYQEFTGYPRTPKECEVYALGEYVLLSCFPLRLLGFNRIGGPKWVGLVVMPYYGSSKGTLGEKK